MYLVFKGPAEPIKKKVKVNISKEKESITSEFKVVKRGQVSFSYPPKIG